MTILKHNHPEHQSQPIEPESKQESRWSLRHKVAAGLATIGLLGGGAAAYKATSGENNTYTPPEQSTSSTENTPKEVTIDKIKYKTTKEQIQYILDNPVTVQEYPTVDEQVTQLGYRWGAILNSAEKDYDAPLEASGQSPLTPESERTFRALAATLYDENSEAWNTLYPALRETAQANASELRQLTDVHSQYIRTSKPFEVNSDGDTVAEAKLDTRSEMEDGKNGYIVVELTLRTFEDGTVRIVHTQEVYDYSEESDTDE